MTRIALATAAGMAERDPDHPLLADALRAVGLEGHLERWDDPEAAWDRYPLVLIRSTWDYMDRREDFVAWARSVEAVTELHNPADVVEWNTDKRYLLDLTARGVPVVPTIYLEPGDPVDLPDATDLVVKPAVSAGAQYSARHGPAQVQAAHEHVQRLLDTGRVVMVQPYLDRIDEAGETGLVYVAGELSHAFRKGPILDVGAPPAEEPFAPEDISPREPTAAELQLGQRVLDAVDRSLLYVRIDLAPGPDGEPLVMEVEATEPSLFLTVAPERATLLAQAVARRVGLRAASGDDGGITS